MRISGLVARLEAIRAEHGDLECETNNYSMGRIPAIPPKVSYRKILSKRERKDDFWCGVWDAPEKRGDKVVRI